MKIDSFRGEYRFLSNFQPARVIMDQAVYPSVEHAYQAAKTLNLILRVAFQSSYTAGQSKNAGRELRLRSDWESIKESLMLDLTRKKFQSDPLKSQLLATGYSELIEGNTWNDTYWGVCRGRGQNKLGKILMQVRKELVDSQI